MTRSPFAATVRRGNPPGAADRVAALTPRRRLQLALAGLWVLDGLMKLQPFMFTKSFAPMTLGDAAHGAPGWLAGPIDWASALDQSHPVGLMLLFAVVELLIGFGIALPAMLRPALAGSMLWAAFLWFFAEGLGGLASGSPSAFTGAPGASILYGLLAALLWPSERDELSEAARFIGSRCSRVVWIALWGLLAFLAFLPVNRSADVFSDVISGNGQGAPSWYVSVLGRGSALTAGHGGAWGVAFGVALALVAVSVLAPWRRAVRAGTVLGVVLAALVWVFGEGFGMPFLGTGTDPGTGPLLALLALAFRPVSRRPAEEPGAPSAGAAVEGVAA